MYVTTVLSTIRIIFDGWGNGLAHYPSNNYGGAGIPEGLLKILRKWIRAASNFANALIPPGSIRQMLAILLELYSKRLYRSSWKEKESRFVFTSSTKHEMTWRHSRAVTTKKRTKSDNARAKLLFAKKKKGKKRVNN